MNNVNRIAAAVAAAMITGKPEKQLPEKCCAKCLHFRESELNPSTMKRETVCVWGPPQVCVLAAQGDIMKMMQNPGVEPAGICGQFTPAALPAIVA